MGTTAELDLRPELSGDQFCDVCGVCISECPAHAISQNTFLGLRCRSYRKARGEYEPHGPEGLLPYCEQCVRVCPKGKATNTTRQIRTGFLAAYQRLMQVMVGRPVAAGIFRRLPEGEESPETRFFVPLSRWIPGPSGKNFHMASGI